MKRLIRNLLIFAITAVLGAVMATYAFAGNEDNWVNAWGTAPVQAQIDGLGEAGSIIGELIGDDSLTEVTVRSVITPTVSGSKLRIKFSNHYNTKPITINGASVAKSLKESKIDMASFKLLSFRDGYPSVTLAPGEEIYSDPISFDVVAHQKIAVTTYFDSFLDVNTMGLSGADTYMATGDALKKDDFDMLKDVLDDEEVLDLMAGLLEGFGMGSSINLKLTYSFMKLVPCITDLDVLTHDLGYSVVVVGDSTVANDFPLYLGQALYEDEDVTSVGVVGKGVLGNCMLYPGLGFGSYIYAESLLQRFTRDVLNQSGVKYVILKIGVNDIIHPVCTDSIVQYPGIAQPSLDTLIRGYREVFKACHDAGVKVIAVGITQWKGATRDYFGDGGTYVRTPAEFEVDWQLAKDVNNWLATTNEHDGYVDFCNISANPLDPDAFLPEYSDDYIHPSAALQKVWANYFPLSLLGVGSMPGGVVMDKQENSVYVGEQTQLTATVYPETAEEKSIEWFSENPEIATVDENGVVTGVSNGTAVISCRTVIGGFKASCKVTVSTKAENIILNYGTNTIFSTETFTLKATVFPENATDKSVTFSTSNKAVASVNSQGKVTGVGTGTAVITCTSADGRIKAICTVTVKKKVHVQNIELRCGGEENYRSHTMYKNQAFELSYVVSPADATFKNVTWSSSDEKVATVDAEGRVVAVGGGTAVIKCVSTDNPMVGATCTVTVKVKATGIKLSNTSLKLYEGKTKTMSAVISPADATNLKVTWKSENSKIAKIDSKGKITALKPGTTYITGTTANGKYTARCKVIVLEVIDTKKVTLNKTSLSIKHGSTYQLKATVSPSNATNKTLIWTSDNTKIVKVSAEGKLTAVKPGTTYIYCKTLDTGKTAKCKVTVKAVVPTSVKFSKTTLSVPYGEIYKIKNLVTVSPSNATDKSLKWTSSDPSIVKVSAAGNIKGLKAGKSAVITVTTVSGKKTAEITVKVTQVNPESVKLNKSSLTLSKGSTATLTPSFTPSNTTVKTVTWTSSNKSVATVSSKGVVKAVANGTAVITCKTKNGETATCTITVKKVAVTGVSIKESGGLIMNVGFTYSLTPVIYPSTATNKKVTWLSSNPAVASVSSSGKVTAKSKGTCQITVITDDGGYSYSCLIVVN